MATAFVLLASWSWRKWADVLVDFGQQLYIPWRLSSGDRLYTDIRLMHGPLSQHVNAVLFWLFGASFSVLIAANLVVLAVLTALIYRLVRFGADRLTATVVCVLLLCLFGFSQYVGTGNYNYIAPYTHESTHGMVFLAGLVVCAVRFIARRQRRDALLAGLCFGCALLTKVDIALAAAAVAPVTVLAAWMTSDPDSPILWSVVLATAAIACAPLASFFGYFATYMPVGAALKVAANGFSLAAGSVASNPFYMRVLGVDDIPAHTIRMAGAALWVAAAAVGAAALDWIVTRSTRRAAVAAAAIGTLAGAALFFEPDLVAWTDLARALPLTTGMALAVFGWQFWRDRRDASRRAASASMMLWAALAVALLSKMVLNARLGHYGFYLAMPATTLLAACAVWWIPQALRTAFGGGLVFRALALAAVVGAASFHLYTSEHDFYRLKTLEVGSGGDRLLTFGHPELPTIGSVVAETLGWIDANMPPNATFAALPEGITLNYLARRRTTLPVINFMMTEEIVFGEDVMLQAFEREPPDYVLLVHKDTSEFGFGRFGDDPNYGRRIMQWVRARYEPVALMGSEPYSGAAFGIKIFKRTNN